MNTPYDVIIIGAGAAGMMCAIEAGKRGRTVWLVDHAKKIGEKIRISGGGRCNFTNIHTSPQNFLSQNPHFCKSALSQYSQQDFIALVKKHGITYHEKTLGQLFCDDSSQQIIDMLLKECEEAGVTVNKETTIETIAATDGGYQITTSKGTATAQSLVIASGGLSIPKIGATNFGYNIAKQFGLNVLPTRAGLVPLTFQNELLAMCKDLTGLSVDATIHHGKTQFSEGLLFTHRGLSGPSILQISSYWGEGTDITVNLLPETNVLDLLKTHKKSAPKQDVQTPLYNLLPRRLVQKICTNETITGRLADLPDKKLEQLASAINNWHIKPNGTEGYRTAEVTLGGVDTTELSSKTMESKKQSGVTGHLGGFNFQWAWSSGYVAGQNV